jgi:hypothetical protein
MSSTADVLELFFTKLKDDGIDLHKEGKAKMRQTFKNVALPRLLELTREIFKDQFVKMREQLVAFERDNNQSEILDWAIEDAFVIFLNSQRPRSVTPVSAASASPRRLGSIATSSSEVSNITPTAPMSGSSAGSSVASSRKGRSPNSNNRSALSRLNIPVSRNDRTRAENALVDAVEKAMERYTKYSNISKTDGAGELNNMQYRNKGTFTDCFRFDLTKSATQSWNEPHNQVRYHQLQMHA